MRLSRNIGTRFAGVALAGAAALGIGATAAVVTTAPASASTVRATAGKPKIQTEPTGWHGHGWKIRPGSVYFGGGASFAAPRARHLHWTYYGQRGAYARGQWFMDTCRPNCARGGYWVSAGAHFYGVYNHAGPGWNFGNARITYGHHSTFHLWIDSAGDWNWR